MTEPVLSFIAFLLGSAGSGCIIATAIARCPELRWRLILLETMNPAAAAAFREVRTSGKFAGIGQDLTGLTQSLLAKPNGFR